MEAIAVNLDQEETGAMSDVPQLFVVTVDTLDVPQFYIESDGPLDVPQFFIESEAPDLENK